METWDGGSDPVWGWEGMPLNITTLPAKLKGVGYKTHLVGKADGFGGGTPDHLPKGRGFDSSLFYFSHANDNYKYTISMAEAGRKGCDYTDANNNTVTFFDLFDGDGPALKEAKYSGKKNVDDVFKDRAISIIQSHDPNVPMFLLFTAHTPHTNLDNPPESFDWTAKAMCKYNSKCLDANGVCSFLSGESPVGVCALKERIDLLSSVHYLDGMIADLRKALKDKKMWGSTMFIFVSDNGGGIGSGVGGSNFPLMGSKGGDWEGGHRTPAFISGGALPKKKRGKSVNGVMHITDWYATLCAMAGADIEDAQGARITGVKVDAVDAKPMLYGKVDDVRDELQLSDSALLKKADGKWYKLLEGVVGNSMHQGPDYPNSTCPSGVDMSSGKPVITNCRPANPAPIGPQSMPFDCGSGCLYEVSTDQGERNNINETALELHKEMVSRLEFLNTPSDSNPGYIEPWRGCELTELLCVVAEKKWQKHYGPIVNIKDCDDCIHLTAAYWANATVKKTTNECQCHSKIIQCRRDDECEWESGECNLKDAKQRSLESDAKLGKSARAMRKRRERLHNGRHTSNLGSLY